MAVMGAKFIGCGIKRENAAAKIKTAPMIVFKLEFITASSSDYCVLK
jgi:hypothetical protein